MNRLFSLTLSLALALGLAACGSAPAPEDSSETVSTPAPETGAAQTPAPETEQTAPPEGGILIAYFTRLDNTETDDLDQIVRGGGPYGPLGDAFDPTQVDAYTSASIQLPDGEPVGSTELVARYIQAQVGGDLFSIQTPETYPTDYDALIGRGNDELQSGYRPALTAQVEDLADYDTVFLGFPNWWYDMPATVYSFLEQHDLSGKRVIPFVTSASSGFSDTIQTIQALAPEADVEENGFSVTMNNVLSGESDVANWLQSLGFAHQDP